MFWSFYSLKNGDVEFTDRPGLRRVGPEVSNSTVIIVIIMLVSITVINVKKTACSLYTMFTATDRKPQKS